MTPHPSPNPAAFRRAQLAKLHLVAKEQGLSEDDYRDKLERLTGKRSAADLTPVELGRAVEMFHGKQNTNQPYTAKVKALFIAAYNLGAISKSSDYALDAFVARQTGKQALRFCSAYDANKVSEAIKAICARHGFTVPTDDQGGMKARQALLLAQWKVLGSLGAVMAEPGALDGYVSRKYLACHGHTAMLTKAQLDDCARAFGSWIRRVKAKAATESGTHDHGA